MQKKHYSEFTVSTIVFAVFVYNSFTIYYLISIVQQGEIMSSVVKFQQTSIEYIQIKMARKLLKPAGLQSLTL